MWDFLTYYVLLFSKKFSVQCSVRSSCCGKFHSFLFNFYTNFHLWPCTKEILPFIFYLFKNKNKCMYLLMVYDSILSWIVLFWNKLKIIILHSEKKFTKTCCGKFHSFFINFYELYLWPCNKKIFPFIWHLFSN